MEDDQKNISSRRAERLRPPAGVTARIKSVLEAEIINISIRGSLLHTPRPLSPGQVYEVRFLGPDCDFKTPARVVSCHYAPGEAQVYRVALEFEDMGGLARSDLALLLRKSRPPG